MKINLKSMSFILFFRRVFYLPFGRMDDVLFISISAILGQWVGDN